MSSPSIAGHTIYDILQCVDHSLSRSQSRIQQTEVSDVRINNRTRGRDHLSFTKRGPVYCVHKKVVDHGGKWTSSVTLSDIWVGR